MALAIATNNAALRAAASASSVNRDMETSMARLSSGKRINSAADDAAGVAISSRLTANIRGTDQAIRNALDGQALIDTAEGAHKEIENILQRMREIAVQAANDTNNAQDRANLQAEMDALSEEINRIAGTTTWAGTKMLDDYGSEFNFHIGAGVSEQDQVKVSIGSMTSSALGLGGSSSSSSGSSSLSSSGTTLAAGTVSTSSYPGEFNTNDVTIVANHPTMAGKYFIQITWDTTTGMIQPYTLGSATDANLGTESKVEVKGIEYTLVGGTQEQKQQSLVSQLQANGINAAVATDGTWGSFVEVSEPDFSDYADAFGINSFLFYADPLDVADGRSNDWSVSLVENYVKPSISGGSSSRTVNNAISGQGTNSIMAIPAQSGASGIDLVIGSVTVSGIDISTGDAAAAAAAITSAINDGNGSPGSGDGTAAHGVTATDALDGAGNINLSFAGSATAADVSAYVSGSGSSSDRTITTPQKVGSEFQVSANINSLVEDPSVAALAQGGFVIAWTGEDPISGSLSQVLTKRYEANGVDSGPEFRIEGELSPFPSVTSFADGGFVVTWNGDGGSSDGSDILGQRFDANGTASGSEFQISNNTESNSGSSVTTLADGGFVVTWNVGSDNIFGQRFNANGAATGSEFQVNSNTSFGNYDSSVTSLVDGGFVVTWEGDGDNNGYWDILGQRYDSNGTTSGPEFQVRASTVIDNQPPGTKHPKVTSLANGGFVVAWNEINSVGENIFAQRYDANGATIGSEFRVGFDDSQNHHAAVTSLADGGFVITRSSTGGNIIGQRFDTNGSATGSEFLVNTSNMGFGYGTRHSVTSMADGGFVVTWTAEDNAADDNNGPSKILGQLFDAGISVSSDSPGSSFSPSGPTLDSPSDAMSAITAIDKAIQTVNIQRSKLGAVSNRLSHTVNNLTNISSNLSAAQGSIEDADFAKETTNLAKNQILQQASTAMLAQANASKQNVLSLLQG